MKNKKQLNLLHPETVFIIFVVIMTIIHILVIINIVQ